MPITHIRFRKTFLKKETFLLEHRKLLEEKENYKEILKNVLPLAVIEPFAKSRESNTLAIGMRLRSCTIHEHVIEDKQMEEDRRGGKEDGVTTPVEMEEERNSSGGRNYTGEPDIFAESFPDAVLFLCDILNFLPYWYGH